MPTSIIKVYNTRYGKWEKNARVVLEWSGWTNLGQTNPVYTDANGQAIVDHSSTGKATVYVNGKTMGSFNAPGSYTAEI